MADVVGNPVIGFVLPWAPNFAPRNWAFCQGQLLAISQNNALFAILGTTYGGDGRNTFGLPDLRGRVAVHAGQGPGLTAYPLGVKRGSETVPLNANQLPAHSHTISQEPELSIQGTTQNGNVPAPTPTARLSGAKLSSGQDVNLYRAGAGNVDMGGLTVSGNVAVNSTGGGQPHNNMQPFQVMNYIICLVGIFPSRN